MSVEATDIRKTFGASTVLDGVNLNAKSGRLTALLGPSRTSATSLAVITAS